jgi:hypothetical protein
MAEFRTCVLLLETDDDPRSTSLYRGVMDALRGGSGEGKPLERLLSSFVSHRALVGVLLCYTVVVGTCGLVLVGIVHSVGATPIDVRLKKEGLHFVSGCLKQFDDALLVLLFTWYEQQVEGCSPDPIEERVYTMAC